MAFSDFKYPGVLRQLGLAETGVPNLFAGVPSVPPTPILRGFLEVSVPLGTAAHTEASRSTWIVGPVLADLWGRYDGQINLIAGAEFDPDTDAGLTGECDFLIGRTSQRPRIQAPVLLVFEAKKDSIPDGLGQCVAGMVGLQRFNARDGTPIDPVYGCVTTGSNWKFLRLTGTTVTVDLTEYGISQVDRILGILTHIVGPIPGRAAA
ncbi:MAG: hypothetical protein ACRC7O_00790 [Fimbriiglobus sp.]